LVQNSRVSHGVLITHQATQWWPVSCDHARPFAFVISYKPFTQPRAFSFLFFLLKRTTKISSAVNRKTLLTWQMMAENKQSRATKTHFIWRLEVHQHTKWSAIKR
jgi:hypothetical protein